MSRIAVIGASCSGKSSIVHTYTEGTPPSQSPSVTIGVDLHVGACDNCNNIYIWDTAGGPSQREVLQHYLPGCHALMVVYDSTKSDEAQVRDVSESLALAKHATRSIEGIPTMIVGTKIDLLPSKPRLPPQMLRYITSRRMQHMFVSCDCVEQVQYAFDELLAQIEQSIPSPLAAPRPPQTVDGEPPFCAGCHIS